MGKLIYSMNVSLDGFVESADGKLDWADVDQELHAWWNDEVRHVDASLYGRRMYEVMSSYWPTADADPSATDTMLDFARIWIAKPKIAFSTTLDTVHWNSRLTTGDVEQELAKLRTEFDGDLDVGGPTLASAFIERGLVDEYRLLVHPVVLGAGKPFFPRLERPAGLRLRDTRVFGSGVVYLGYTAAA